MSAGTMQPLAQPEARIASSSTAKSSAGSAATPLWMKDAFQNIASPGRQNAALALSALFKSSTSDETSPRETTSESKDCGGKAEVKSTVFGGGQPQQNRPSSSSSIPMQRHDSTTDFAASSNGSSGHPSVTDHYVRPHSAPPTAGGRDHGGGYHVPHTNVHPGYYHPHESRPYTVGLPQQPPYGYSNVVPAPGGYPAPAAPMPMQCTSGSTHTTAPHTTGTDDGSRRMRIFMEATRSLSSSPPRHGHYVTPSPHHHHHYHPNSHLQHSYPPPPPNYNNPAHSHVPAYPVGPPSHQNYSYPTRKHAVPMTPKSSAAPRPQKKQKLNGATKSAAATTPKSTTNAEYKRGDKSLGLLCKRFMATYASLPVAPLEGEGGSSISIDDAARTLGVERRRIYDIINILEAVQIVSRERKNTYRWHGAGNLPIFLARKQKEAIKLWSDDARKNGLANGCDDSKAEEPAEDESIASSSDSKSKKESGGAQKEKSLGKLSVKFIQLFLVGNETVSLTDASDRILGTKSADLIYKAAGKSAEAKEAARGMKTKIRRLYDIANVLASLNIIIKVNSGSSYTQKNNRPSFRWIYNIHPKKFPEILVRPEHGMEERSKRQEIALGPTASAKKILAKINQCGGDDGSMDEENIAVVTQDDSSDESL